MFIKGYFATCNYDEQSFDSYDGIHIQKDGKEVVIINTGDFKTDETFLARFIKHVLKLPQIGYSSKIDNYAMDLSNGKPLSDEDENNDEK